MTELVPAVDGYLADLAAAQQHDQTLVEMETRAEALGFPIVGRAVGRHLELLARAIGARRVCELGSGFGYSAYWFARAVGEGGEVVCTDQDPANATTAESYLRRAELWDRVRFEVGDADRVLAAEDGAFDVIFNDADKGSYPALWEQAADRLRVGGLYVCDNVLWDGRVAGMAADPDPERERVTAAIAAHNREIAIDPRFVSSIAPIRDGVLTALRIA